MIETTSDPSYAVDDAGCIAAWNKAAEKLFGLPAETAIGKRCYEVINGTDEYGAVCSADCVARHAARNDQAIRNYDLQAQTAIGMQWCNVSLLTANAENFATRYLIHVVRVIDVRKRAELFVRDLVSTGTDLLAERAGGLSASADAPARDVKLSPRECEVLRLLARGMTTRAAAAELRISAVTAKNHVQRILHKLGSHTRQEAIRRAQRGGLI